VPLFKGGQLPDSTPANFPNPALLQYNHIPEFEHAFLNYYDTAGEVFLDSQQIKRAGYFVGHSDIVLFIVSLADCDFQELDNTMARLLDNYVRAVYDHLNVDLKQRQRIIVTFTKADLIAERLPRELYNWLKEGGADWYMRHIAQNRLLLNENSFQIENWLRDELGCNRFLNMLRGNFREVRFTLVSATGLPGEAGPAAQEQGPAYEPLRVMDPFLWILRFTQEYQPARRPNYPRPLRQLLQKLGW
jgi:hypothetical protein